MCVHIPHFHVWDAHINGSINPLRVNEQRRHVLGDTLSAKTTRPQGKTNDAARLKRALVETVTRKIT